MNSGSKDTRLETHRLRHREISMLIIRVPIFLMQHIRLHSCFSRVMKTCPGLEGTLIPGAKPDLFKEHSRFGSLILYPILGDLRH